MAQVAQLLNIVAGAYSTTMNTLKDANGRSNFNKALQYGTKLLALSLAEADPKDAWAKDLNTASATINTGRKLAGLGQSLDCVAGVLGARWGNPRETLRGLSSLCTLFFWGFDNLIFLHKAKLSTALEADGAAARYAMFCFFFAQLFAAAGEAMDLQKSAAKAAALAKTIKHNKTTGADSSIARAELVKVKAELLWGYIGLASRAGNLTYSANGWNLTAALLGQNFSEKTCTYAGLLSAVLALAKNVDVASRK